jgi:hypothetical protein
MATQTYTIEYGKYIIAYEIEGDVDGNKAIVQNVTYNGNKVDYNFFDKGDLADMKFHCEEDFSNRQMAHYKATGETL